MRQIINISMPPQMAVQVAREVKTGKYASTSEFFRYLMREWHAQKLTRELRQSRKEFAAGKGKLLHSLRNLR